MKTKTDIKTRKGDNVSRPPPFVHPSSEPEYDTEQVARRASQVTDVLEHILQEHPALGEQRSGPPSLPPPV